MIFFLKKKCEESMGANRAELAPLRRLVDISFGCSFLAVWAKIVLHLQQPTLYRPAQKLRSNQATSPTVFEPNRYIYVVFINRPISK